ncbi:PREDICTED: swi5-dependent recombination DNA repair protein 1 homolog [Chrysochloris asiatica]|uniref:Swi5-dependent recombination DNA repair protein 1 homolog n=1 Tax=Chrysochloris asiatica TaxID=185453 RepID=A0A9B0U6Q7_CHRAS|nr:PREDICTED: swi5-dependent recombination DNA repair protein 1 homolog [Chrysochloris asiatica]
MKNPSDSPVTLPCTPQACETPPSPHINSSRKQPMSAALRERLRKTRSSFPYCYSIVEGLKVEIKESDPIVAEKPLSSTEENCLEYQENFKHVNNELEESICLKSTFKNISAEEQTRWRIGACESKSDSALQNNFVSKNLPKQRLQEEKANLVKQIQEKEDFLQKLKLVKMYRSKNDLSQIRLLIQKWRKCSQLLLDELQSALSEENKKGNLTELIDHYGLDDKLLHYNGSEEEFIDV